MATKYQFHNDKFSARFRQDLPDAPTPTKAFQKPIQLLMEKLKSASKRKRKMRSPIDITNIVGTNYSYNQLMHMASTANFIALCNGLDYGFACLYSFEWSTNQPTATLRLVRKMKPSNLGKFIWANGAREYLVYLLGEETLKSSGRTLNRKYPSTEIFENRMVELGKKKPLGSIHNVNDIFPKKEKRPSGLSKMVDRANLELYNSGTPRVFVNRRFTDTKVKRSSEYILVEVPDQLIDVLDSQIDTGVVKELIEKFTHHRQNGKLPVVVKSTMEKVSIKKKETPNVPARRNGSAKLNSEEFSVRDLVTAHKVLTSPDARAAAKLSRTAEWLDEQFTERVHQQGKTILSLVDEQLLSELK